MRRPAAAGASALFVLPLLFFLTPPALAQHALGGSEVVVAVIDSGLDATHQEFSYDGPNDATDQVVAWWDFTSERKPAARTDPFAFGAPLWDLDIADPYDGNGHGTGTASLVGGANAGACGQGASTTPKESYAPGVKLAVAKVSLASGDVAGDLALAVRWATDVVHADVISLSIGATRPSPDLGDPAFDALHRARRQGVLPIVLAHNGLENAGLAPYPSWMGPYASSPDAFVVGGGRHDGTTLTSTTGNDDPDVASWSDSVCIAAAGSGNGYLVESGTSFATPLVAGMAARAMELAIQNGHPGAAAPDAIVDLLHRCARDTVAPYAREGWGFLEAQETFGCIIPNARAGAMPTYHAFSIAGRETSPAVNPAYDETVRAAGRTAFSAPPGSAAPTGPELVRTSLSVGTAQGVLGASAPVGLTEAEGYLVHLNVGQRLVAKVRYASVGTIPTDLDAMIVPASAWSSGTIRGADRLAVSANGPGVDEIVEHEAVATGDYALVVFGHAIPQSQAFNAIGAPFAYAGQGLFVGMAQTLV